MEGVREGERQRERGRQAGNQSQTEGNPTIKLSYLEPVAF